MHLEALMDLGLYHEMESKNYEMLHYLKGPQNYLSLLKLFSKGQIELYFFYFYIICNDSPAEGRWTMFL